MNYTEFEEIINDYNGKFYLNLDELTNKKKLLFEYPANSNYQNDVQNALSKLEQINNSSLNVRPKIISEIDNKKNKIQKMNMQINKLKMQNKKLMCKNKGLNDNVATSEEFFDNQLEWYRHQMKYIFIMVIGILILFYFFKTLGLDAKSIVISIVIVLFFSYIIVNIFLWIYGFFF